MSWPCGFDLLYLLPLVFYLISLSAGLGRCKGSGEVAMATWSPPPAGWDGRALLGEAGTGVGSLTVPLYHWLTAAHEGLSHSPLPPREAARTPHPQAQRDPQAVREVRWLRGLSGPWRGRGGGSTPWGSGSAVRPCDPPAPPSRKGGGGLLSGGQEPVATPPSCVAPPGPLSPWAARPGSRLPRGSLNLPKPPLRLECGRPRPPRVVLRVSSRV